MNLKYTILALALFGNAKVYNGFSVQYAFGKKILLTMAEEHVFLDEDGKKVTKAEIESCPELDDKGKFKKDDNGDTIYGERTRYNDYTLEDFETNENNQNAEIKHHRTTQFGARKVNSFPLMGKFFRDYEENGKFYSGAINFSHQNVGIEGFMGLIIFDAYKFKVVVGLNLTASLLPTIEFGAFYENCTDKISSSTLEEEEVEKDGKKITKYKFDIDNDAINKIQSQNNEKNFIQNVNDLAQCFLGHFGVSAGAKAIYSISSNWDIVIGLNFNYISYKASIGVRKLVD